jgi:hypothetical protein
MSVRMPAARTIASTTREYDGEYDAACTLSMRRIQNANASARPLFFSFHPARRRHSSRCHHTRRHQTRRVLLVDIIPHRQLTRHVTLATLLAATVLTAILIAIVLVASFSPSYLPHLTRHHIRRVILAIVLAAGILVDIEYSSSCIVQLPAASVTLRAVLTKSQSSPLSYSSRLTRHHTRRVPLAIVLAAGILTDIVLVTLYCTTSRSSLSL